MNTLIIWFMGLLVVWKIVQGVRGRTAKTEPDHIGPPKWIALIVLGISFAAVVVAAGTLFLLPPRLIWVTLAIILVSQQFRSWMIARDWHSRSATHS